MLPNIDIDGYNDLREQSGIRKRAGALHWKRHSSDYRKTNSLH
jgi:hypothetical protein